MATRLTDSPSRLSILWQDALLKISQSLLQQRSIPDLLRALDGVSFSVVRFGRVNLILLDPLHNQMNFYRYDRESGRTQCSEEAVLLANGPGGVVWSTQTPLHCDRTHFLRDFPHLTDQPAYAGLSDYCQLPLCGTHRGLGGVEFLKTDGSRFTDNELDFFQALAGVVALVVENISEREQVLQEEERLRHERDHLRILVDVTNTVISKLELKALALEVSREIHRFFGIDFIALVLKEGEGEAQALKYLATVYPQAGAPKTVQGEVERAQTLADGVMAQHQPLLVRVAERPQAGEPRPLSQWFDHALSHVCLLPLAFGNRTLGVLELAHRSALAVSEADLRLLRQIAARIAIALDNALAYEQITRMKDSLVHENFYLTEQLTEHIHQRSGDEFGEIIGRSAAIRQVLEQVEMVAASDSTVLILGETGTGKELIARAIHSLSQRKARHMVKMNCAAIPSGLLESDLFGHEKGAFTGATSQRQGRFELADNSTLFLDEVGDIPLELQPKLLRVLQEREIERLGGSKVIAVDVRLIAATNRDLKQMVADREYRSDLYYRLNVFPIVIPPLRERPEDIPLLVKFFTRKIARRMNRTIDSIPSDMLRQLSCLPWPGNVRELENVVERAVILTRGTTLNLQIDELQHHLSPLEVPKPAHRDFTPPPPVAAEPSSGQLDAEEESERERIIRVLRETNGIVAGPKGAAARLGLKRTTLLSRMQRMGISAREIEGIS
ncbi:formate hydrogenlyase transcriptional activator FlhA [Dickeya fangzhongdai]|uniref:Formate hydrogenlyase transcriptional activator FlhA n=1 Tax=Dickeya fangzhongdai TaxID=1778540 RepID=A0A2K8QK77_9GAMM|nr:formate hydrogenlyase transcriptional activator FlhA [Dickeya fangzhongdai]ATZ93927.1 formate hydrogenlyase transcriptional activator FlhA [Dickeya fangzhongdai]QOH47363.1 formate hydrogenlyase transcriptional activator FlhA [Dickeya fangzhongdai]QOH51669.1 formate hydrogenlyase transcriptional activator FlhA [Dickeya fangzhongdai]WOY01142.1 formate hydrogenlyase transcriptional activator FlhA [Dickeya fangzhongdai]WOY03708.1 formate hydrogenlyase transcriptional activator FlhA [Dickeya fan